MSAFYEVWIKKTHRETWSPMLYASVLAMFWTVLGVLQSQSPVKIHVLGPSNLLLGLTKTGHLLLKTRYRELVTAIGAVFEDLKTKQFLDRDIISKPTVPSTWKKELVGTVYILDVAPWWYLSDLTEALAPSVQCRYIADRVRWSVGEMRTATWRLTGESVSQLIGKVYLSDSGMPPMFVISEADYEARKKRITDRLSAGLYDSESSEEDQETHAGKTRPSTNRLDYNWMNPPDEPTPEETHEVCHALPHQQKLHGITIHYTGEPTTTRWYTDGSKRHGRAGGGIYNGTYRDLPGARATTGLSGRNDRLRRSLRASQAWRRHYTRQLGGGESHTYKTQRGGQGPRLPRHRVPQFHHETIDDTMDTRTPRTSHHV